ncbi:MAG: hypothetical protein J0L82_15075 [Deltaproteobacteria bacterium]|nr:hypothetical protein [Deltaproteobacteria bacterium]
MKKNILALSLILFAASWAGATSYPTESYNQKVHVVKLADHAFVARVNNVQGSQYILGYKDSGPLAQNRPARASIDAVITVTCMVGRTTSSTFTKTISIGREWNNRGYLSAASAGFGYWEECGYPTPLKIQIAFSDRFGAWDSSYELKLNDFYDRPALVYDTNQQGRFGTPEPNDLAWQFVIGLL